MAKKKNKPMSTQQKRDWLKANSEKLVKKTFENLEDNFKAIDKDYKAVYTDVITNLSKAIEDHIVNDEIKSPMMLQNKFVQIVQLAVNQLTLLDTSHDKYLKKLLRSYHTTITDYQIGLIKMARDEGILFTELELNETALNIASQFPYKEFDFVTGLNNGTFKVQDKLNKILSQSVITGASIPKVVPEIEKAFNIKRHIAERIARTETSRVLNTATLNVYKQAGLNKVKWLDSTEAIARSKYSKTVVCKDCREVATTNNGVYTFEELPQLPLHPHCRCTVVPIVE